MPKPDNIFTKFKMLSYIILDDTSKT